MSQTFINGKIQYKNRAYFGTLGITSNFRHLIFTSCYYPWHQWDISGSGAIGFSHEKLCDSGRALRHREPYSLVPPFHSRVDRSTMVKLLPSPPGGRFAADLGLLGVTKNTRKAVCSIPYLAYQTYTSYLIFLVAVTAVKNRSTTR